MNLANTLRKLKFLGKIFHTLDYCLQRELRDCESVLDLGCGPSSPLQYCKNVKYSIGVEAFTPYLAETQKRKIHTEYINKRIEEVDFPENSFDAVIMIEVLEHFPKETGYEILKKADKWAKKKIIVSSPNGFLAQKEVDSNPLQKHLSGWDYEKMKSLDFKCYGLAGLKFLWHEIESDTMESSQLQRIRLKPKIFWLAVASLTQIGIYYLPFYSFGLLSVKQKL
ncbi:MAG: class I SAM-dependent methyltransferase [bacterium]